MGIVSRALLEPTAARCTTCSINHSSYGSIPAHNHLLHHGMGHGYEFNQTVKQASYPYCSVDPSKEKVKRAQLGAGTTLSATVC